jgi:hypothetical protein
MFGPHRAVVIVDLDLEADRPKVEEAVGRAADRIVALAGGGVRLCFDADVPGSVAMRCMRRAIEGSGFKTDVLIML